MKTRLISIAVLSCLSAASQAATPPRMGSASRDANDT